MTNLIFWLIPLSALTALLFAYYFYKTMMKNDEGTDDMKRIALYVREGAMAYLRRQYRVVTMVFGVLAVLLAILAFLDVQNPFVPIAFFDGWIFFRTMRLSGNENSHQCFGSYGFRSNKIAQ